MNFKAVFVATLLVSSFSFSSAASAEKALETMPESLKQKEERLESDLNALFEVAVKTAAYKLDETKQVPPFGVIKKMDKSIGVFEAKGGKFKTVEEKSASIRRLLIELAASQQIEASVMVMYSVVKQKGKDTQQGLMFEVEHKEGISIMRFLPITKKEDPTDKTKTKLVFELQSLVTNVKPQTVFARSIVQ